MRSVSPLVTDAEEFDARKGICAGEFTHIDIVFGTLFSGYQFSMRSRKNDIKVSLPSRYTATL